MSVDPLETPSESLNSVLPTDLDASIDSGFWKLHDRRIMWWDSNRTKAWFREKGYTLYSRMPTTADFSPSHIMFPTNAGEMAEDLFPYAYKNIMRDSTEPVLNASTGERGIISYAQDSQGRHVAIKAVLDGSEELRIINYLRTRAIPSSIEEFDNVIPILDVLAYEGHWLVVMPRWGIHPLYPEFGNPQQVLHFIHCLLKGLNNLHTHRIAHA
ncbi:hypothetical protein H0H93_006780, partial [Arthromyces matolae]